jgi:hypothetical protein
MPEAFRYADDADDSQGSSLLVEPPRRLWRPLLAGVVLFVAGCVVGVMLTMELLSGEMPPRQVAGNTRAEATANARAGAEVPVGPASSGMAEQLRRDAERMQANAELAAMRQAAVAERARLVQLAEQRSTAEAELAALQEQARARPEPGPEPLPEAPAEPAAVVAGETPLPAPRLPAPALAAPLVATPVAPPMAPVVAPVVVPVAPPPATPRQAPRARGEARAEARPDGRVQLHYLAGSPAARQAAEDAAAVLRDAGLEGVELRPVAEVPDNRLVRYHRAEDAGAAARLAGRLGRGWALQDSRGYDPVGNGRSLEVWLPDK